MSESVNIKLKRAAIVLANELDYPKPAERLNINVAELKKLIHSLEGQLCLYIFRSRESQVELTEEGKYLIRVFRQSVALHDRELSEGTAKTGE